MAGTHHGRNKGPTLPATLLGDLGVHASHQKQRRGQPTRKELRKQQRHEKKASRNVHQCARQQPQRTTQVQHGPATGTGKRKQLERHGAPPSSKRTRFDELLQGSSSALVAGGRGVNSAAAYLADLRAAREAEKKLGIKKGGVLKGPSDGLSGLLDGISSARGDLLPSYLGAGAAAQAKSLLGGRRAAQDSDPGGAQASGFESDSDDLGLGVLQHDSGDRTESDSEDFGFGSDSSESDGEGSDPSPQGTSSHIADSSSDASGDASEDGVSGDDSEDDAVPGRGVLGRVGAEQVLAKGGSHPAYDTNGPAEVDRGSEDLSEGPGPSPHTTSSAPPGAGRYVPPALRRQGSVDNSGVERRITGLLNRLAETNLSGIAKDVVALYSEHRRLVVAAVTSSLVQAATRGPRATPAFAMTAATLVTGVAGLCQAPELVAAFIESTAQHLEASIRDRDSLSSHNLIQLLASCHAAGMVSTDLVYGCLQHLVARFTEEDVTLVATLLTARGLALRNADPGSMKDLVVAVSSQVAAAGAAGSATSLSTRARMMLELVIDIKNNRPTTAAGGASGKRSKGNAQHSGGVAIRLHPSLTAWLKTCNVGSVMLRGITWQKTLLPDKKGMWWLPEAGDAHVPHTGGRGGLSGVLEAAGGVDTASEAAELLKLAAAQRMNTDTRRAVFVAIMGAADVVHAQERVLRLPLKGDQQREVVRVVVDCCLHEAVYNPFYALLLVRLITDSKAHRLTTQYCLWDHYKTLQDLSSLQLTHLARLNATLLAKDALPITVLKVADLGSALEPKPLFFWRLCFQHLLAACKTVAQVTKVFSRVSAGGAQSQASSKTGSGGFKAGMLLFLRTKLGPWLASQDTSQTVGKSSSDDLLLLLREAEAAVKGGGVV